MTEKAIEKAKELSADSPKKSSSDKCKFIPISSSDMLFLSELYRQGAGQTKDLDSARKWLMKAVDMNDCTAIEMLAMDYLNGNELYTKDEKTAISWFEKAAELGSSDAQVFLGLAHLLEIGGVPFQPLTSMFWLKKAAERGNPDAEEVLSTFYEIDGNNKTEINFEKLKKSTEKKK